MKKYEYRGYIIKKGPYGWFATPQMLDYHKDRWGCSPNMNSKLAVENWVDDMVIE